MANRFQIDVITNWSASIASTKAYANSVRQELASLSRVSASRPASAPVSRPARIPQPSERPVTLYRGENNLTSGGTAFSEKRGYAQNFATGPGGRVVAVSVPRSVVEEGRRRAAAAGDVGIRLPADLAAGARQIGGAAERLRLTTAASAQALAAREAAQLASAATPGSLYRRITARLRDRDESGAIVPGAGVGLGGVSKAEQRRRAQRLQLKAEQQLRLTPGEAERYIAEATGSRGGSGGGRKPPPPPLPPTPPRPPDERGPNDPNEIALRRLVSAKLDAGTPTRLGREEVARQTRERRQGLQPVGVNADRELLVAQHERIDALRRSTGAILASTAAENEARVQNTVVNDLRRAAVRQAADAQKLGVDPSLQGVEQQTAVDAARRAETVARRRRRDQAELGLAPTGSDHADDIAIAQARRLRKINDSADAFTSTSKEEIEALTRSKVGHQGQALALRKSIAATNRAADETSEASGFQKFLARAKGNQAPAESQPTLGQAFSAKAAISGEFAAAGSIIYGGVRTISEMVSEAERLQAIFSQIKDQFRTLGDESELKGFRQAILGIARDTGTTGEEVATVGFQMKGAFGDTTRAIEETRGALKVSIVTGLEQKELTDSLTAAAKTYGVSIESIGDAALGVQDRFGVLSKETLKVFGDMAPAAHEAGLSVQELGAIVGTVQQVSSKSGQSIADSLSRILPSIGTKGAELAKLYASVPSLAPKLPELASNLRTGQTGRVFLELIRDYGSLSKAQQQYVVSQLGGRREAQTLDAVFGHSAQLLKGVSDAQNDAGKTSRRFNELQQTLGQTFKRLREEIRQLGDAIARAGLFSVLQTIAGGSEAVLKAVGGVVRLFGDLNEASGGVVGQLVSVAVAIKGIELAMVALRKVQVGGAILQSIAVNLAGGAGTTAATSAATSATATAGSGLLGGLLGSLGLKGARSLYSGGGAPVATTEVAAGGTEAAASVPEIALLAGVLLALNTGAKKLEKVVRETPSTPAVDLHQLSAPAIATIDANPELTPLERFRARKAELDKAKAAKPAYRPGSSLNPFDYRGSASYNKANAEYYGQLLEPDTTAQLEKIANRQKPGLGARFRDSAGASREAARIDEARRKVGERYAADPDRRGHAQDVLDSIKAADLKVGNRSGRVANDLLSPDVAQFLKGKKQKTIDELQAGIDAGDKKAFDELAKLEKKYAKKHPKYAADLADRVAKRTKAAADQAQDAVNTLEEVQAKFDLGEVSFDELAKAYQQNISLLRSTSTGTPEDKAKIAQAVEQWRKALSDNVKANIAAIQQITQLGDVNPAVGIPAMLEQFRRVYEPPPPPLPSTSGGSAVDYKSARAQNDNPDADPAAALDAANTIVQTTQQGNAYAVAHATSAAQEQQIIDNAPPLDPAVVQQIRDYQMNTFGRIINDPVAVAQDTVKKAIDDAVAAATAKDTADLGTKIFDPVEAAGVAQRNANRRLAEVTGPKAALFSDTDRDNARAAVTQANEQARQATSAIASARLDLLAAAAQGDPVAEARIEQQKAAQAATDAQGDAAKIEAQAAKIRADRGLADAIEATFQAQLDLAAAVANAADDTVGAAQVGLQKAQEKLSYDQSHLPKGTDLSSDYAAVITAQANVRDTTLAKEEADIDFALQMGKITKAAAIKAYEVLASAPTNTIKMTQDLLLKIKSLKDSAGQDLQFNLPTDINLPTLYEVRRSRSASAAGAGYQDNRQVTATFYINNGMDLAQAADFLAEATGGAPTLSTAVRKY